MNSEECKLFIALLSYKASLEKIDTFRNKHLDFLDNYYRKNVFIVSGPKVPREGGVIIARCDNKQKLLKILKQDPFAINDLATYEVIEFSATKCTHTLKNFALIPGNQHE